MIKNENNKEKRLILQRARLDTGNLQFDNEDGFKTAIENGFFLLKRPVHIDLEPGLKLANSFYKNTDKNNPYEGFKEKEGVYFDREHFQTEHILLDQHARKELFPEELNKLCNQMNDIGIIILKSICQKLGMASRNWDEVTCGTLKNEGTHWFACSHYRSELKRPGCAVHQDTGFVTVLHIDQEGLEALIDDEWVDIEPVQGYFVINFGASLEILTKNLKNPVKAVLHKVREIKSRKKGNDRYSFAAFLNPPAHLDLYQYSSRGNLEKYMPVKDFLEKFNKSTWYDRHDQFGIG